MPACTCCRYVEQNGSAAILAVKRLSGVTPEITLRECVTPVHSGFKPRGDITSSLKQVAPRKGLMSSKNIFKKQKKNS